MPTVSVITVTYNHGPFIGKCIESVLEQTFSDWEQIIVDDGSTDTTAEIADQYCLNDGRVRLVQHHHVGPYRMSELYNRGLAACKGKLIAVLEGDDYWPTWKLEKQILAFMNENVILTWGKVIEVDEKGVQLAMNPADSEPYLRLKRSEAVKRLLFGCYIPSVSVMCRKSALELIGGFRQSHNIHCVDYPTWLALAPLGELKFLDSVLGYWVKRNNSLSSRSSKSTAWCNCSIDALENMPQELKTQIGFTELELMRLLQDNLDSNVDIDLENVRSKSDLMHLLGRHLRENTIHGISTDVSMKIRTLNVLRIAEEQLLYRTRRKLFHDHDLKDAAQTFGLVLACMNLRRAFSNRDGEVPRFELGLYSRNHNG